MKWEDDYEWLIGYDLKRGDVAHLKVLSQH